MNCGLLKTLFWTLEELTPSSKGKVCRFSIFENWNIS
jgi:hypothetical protein